MREGPVDFFKFHEIIQDKHDDLFYVYNLVKTEIYNTTTLDLAKEYILDKICYIKKKDLEHEGVEIIIYDHNELTILLSVKKEIYEQFPQFKEFSYSSLIRYSNFSKWEKYLHNERNPAWVTLEAKVENYYWHGQQLSKQHWEKAVRDKNFKNSINSFLDEEIT